MNHPEPSRRNHSQTGSQIAERFVAFAFAGAEIVIETDASGTIIFAAGAVQSRFDRPPEALLGTQFLDLVALVDQAAAERAVLLLSETRRLLPMTVRLANSDCTAAAMGGVALVAQTGDDRLCFSLARLPTQVVEPKVLNSMQDLALTSELRIRAGAACNLGLLQVSGKGIDVNSSARVVGALKTAVPNIMARQVAPGRFGVLYTDSNLAQVANLLEATLQAQGADLNVTSTHLALSSDGLTRTQATRALRQALNLFAKKGSAGLAAAGFGGGLAGFVTRAGVQARSLRLAIQERRFDLVFQPIVTLQDGLPSHYEALIRPSRGMGTDALVPQEFVLMVEALELAPELDVAVARVACETAMRARTPIAFNISGQSLQVESFREQIFSILHSSPAVKDGLIKVEVTETAEIEDLSGATEMGEMLRSLHVPFCLDDFGSGAADIRLLRATRADIVKLDGSYIPGIVENGRERALLSGVTEMARAAGAEVVAERIETEAEAKAVREAGIKYGQGWLFGRPGALPRAKETVHRRINRPGG